MNTTRALIVLGALLVLAAVNYAIYAKERIIAGGETIYLELAPVDPRSLMQGDYMTLRFALAGQIDAARSTGSLDPRARSVPLSVDERGVATLAAHENASPLSIRFRVRGRQIWLGTNAYFFEEGTADRFAGARFGEFKIDRETGEAVLVGLRGESLQAL